jgi:hypothetical protein
MPFLTSLCSGPDGWVRTEPCPSSRSTCWYSCSTRCSIVGVWPVRSDTPTQLNRIKVSSVYRQHLLLLLSLEQLMRGIVEFT